MVNIFSLGESSQESRGFSHERFKDGELVYKNEEGLSDSEAFQKGTGIANSKSANKTQLKLKVFDLFPIEEFLAGKSKANYSERRIALDNARKTIALNNISNLEIVDLVYEVNDHSQIDKWLEYAENNDWEGIMINLDTPYECKRSKNLIKVKKFYSFDLEIVGYEEGTGKNEGLLGAFIVNYKGNHVGVGSGFSDDERKIFWENREQYLGRVTEVRFKEITIDKKTGKESLQFPTFKGLREIGKEVSYD